MKYLSWVLSLVADCLSKVSASKIVFTNRKPYTVYNIYQYMHNRWFSEVPFNSLHFWLNFQIKLTMSSEVNSLCYHFEWMNRAFPSTLIPIFCSLTEVALYCFLALNIDCRKANISGSEGTSLVGPIHPFPWTNQYFEVVSLYISFVNQLNIISFRLLLSWLKLCLAFENIDGKSILICG